MRSEDQTSSQSARHDTIILKYNNISEFYNMKVYDQFKLSDDVSKTRPLSGSDRLRCTLFTYQYEYHSYIPERNSTNRMTKIQKKNHFGVFEIQSADFIVQDQYPIPITNFKANLT